MNELDPYAANTTYTVAHIISLTKLPAGFFLSSIGVSLSLSVAIIILIYMNILFYHYKLIINFIIIKILTICI